MNAMRRRYLLVLVVCALALAAGAIAYSRGSSGRQSPTVLNEPTAARRVRVLHAGAEPGMPTPRYPREQHADAD